jgi:hypothetical protein
MAVTRWPSTITSRPSRRYVAGVALHVQTRRDEAPSRSETYRSLPTVTATCRESGDQATDHPKLRSHSTSGQVKTLRRSPLPGDIT